MKQGNLPEKTGGRIDNIPHTGTLTGVYEIDFFGCWWEVTGDDGTTFWMIGEYPQEELCQISNS
jgi:hypothetical protein